MPQCTYTKISEEIHKKSERRYTKEKLHMNSSEHTRTVQLPKLHTDQRNRKNAGLKESWETLKSVLGLTRSLSLQRD